MRSVPLLLLLSGCWYLDDDRYSRKVQDVDGDGGIAERFGGPDCVDDDPSIADCDADNDGFRSVAVGGDDCDDTRADVRPDTPWYLDSDGDGHGAPEDSRMGCGPATAGWSLDPDDCDDRNAAVFPGAEETCDGLDRNCDGDAFRDAVDATIDTWPDGDGDGWGDASASSTKACAASEGWVTLPGDCDDTNPAIRPDAEEIPYDGTDQDCVPANEYDLDLDGFDVDVDCDDTNPDVYPSDGSSPGAPERCDGIDNDCDGLVDDEEIDADQAPFDQVTWYLDGDGDGYGGGTPVGFCPTVDPGPGYFLLADDCNDANDAVFPGAVEWCNGADDDCNGTIDEGTAVDAFTAFVDADGDGFGNQPISACSLSVDVDGDGDPELLSFVDGDCYDQFADAYPGAPEICGDAIRQDCSSAPVDDCDDDGTPDATDCVIDDPEIYPGADERCDGVDNDCDTLIDDADPDVEDAAGVVWYADTDGDGFGDGVTLSGVCARPVGSVREPGDCDDAQPSVYPLAPEICDGRDNDCDGALDEGVANAPRYYFDGDGDGSGDPGNFVNACSAPSPSWLLTGNDCDDRDPANGPLLVELCDDFQDNDCDGLIDDLDDDAELVDGTLFYVDGDGDGYGTGNGLTFCSNPDPQAYSTVGGDCNDADPAETVQGTWFEDKDLDGHGGTLAVVIGCQPTTGSWYPFADDCLDNAIDVYPGALEFCNLRDDDCDGTLDNNPDLSDPDAIERWPDADGDGDGDANAAAVTTCFDGFGLVPTNTDCDDSNPAMSGLLLEICGDPFDNNCDGTLDDDTVWYLDADNDGFGDLSTASPTCDGPPTAEYVSAAGDCNDNNPEANPGKSEVCGDGIDNNCDLQTDEGCVIPPAVGCVGWQWVDGDGDGYGNRNTTPVFECAALGGYSDLPADCDDSPGSPSPNDVTIDPTTVSTLNGLSGCNLVRAAPGVYPLTGYTPGGSVSLTIVPTDPTDRPVFRGPTASGTGPFTPSGGTSLILKGIEVEGGGGAYRLLTVNGAATTVAAVDTHFDGDSTASGIRADNGLLALYDASAANVFAATAEGSGLWVKDSATAILDGYRVIDATGPTSSITLETPDTISASRLGITRGPGLRVTDSAAGYYLSGINVELWGLDLRAITGDAVTLDAYYTSTVIERSVIVGATGSGIRALPAMGHDIELLHSTVLACDEYGLVLESGGLGTITVDSSILLDSTLADIETNPSGYGYYTYSSPHTVIRSTVGTTTESITSPAGSVDFITYTPGLPADRADLHLRSAVPVGADADDVGAYSRLDGWYDDATSNQIFDGWEVQYGVVGVSVSSTAEDTDTLNLFQEFTGGTSPRLSDTDGDTFPDHSDITPLSPGP